MKHLFLATLIALCLLVAPAALASSGPSGTYVTTVRSAGNLNGTYRITFHPGRFTLSAPYGLTGHGTDSVHGSRITLWGPGSCRSAGTYEWWTSGSHLTFRRVHDSCPRAKVLTAHSLNRA